MTGTALLIHWLVLTAQAQQSPRLRTGTVVLVLGASILGFAAWTVGWYRLLGWPRAG